LQLDHDNAKFLAHALNDMNAFSLDPQRVETNIVFAKLDDRVNQESLIENLASNGITVSKGQPMRFVTHKDVTREDIEHLIKTLIVFFGK